MTPLDEDSASAVPNSSPNEGVRSAAAGAPSLRERQDVPPSPESPWGLPFYLFVEPIAIGKVVVDLSPGGGPGPELLRRAGAVEVFSPGRAGLPLPFPSGGADLVLCGLPETAVVAEDQRAALLAEVHRVLRRDGMCAIRVVASSLANLAMGVTLRAALADLLLEHFATVDIVEETPFRGVSFFSPGSDELAVSEAIARLAGNPSHLIALCTTATDRSWHLSESLLVPTGPGLDGVAGEGELSAWRAEVERLAAEVANTARERDELRESQMTLQDRSEKLARTAAVLRKDVERYLRQISDDGAARELLAMERDQAKRRLAAAADEIEKASREIEKQKASVQALRKEVARLRAARGAAGSGRGPA